MAFDMLPSGVRLLPELISADQEAALVRAVDAGPWDEAGANEGHRSRQFGWWRPQLLSQSGQPDRFLGALPDWAAPLVSRLHVLAPFDYAPDHLIVREIRPGAQPQMRQGEGRTVATLALLGDLPVLFRRRATAGTWHLTQAQRSLMVLTERFDLAWDRTILPFGLPGSAGPESGREHGSPGGTRVGTRSDTGAGPPSGARARPGPAQATRPETGADRTTDPAGGRRLTLTFRRVSGF